MSDTDMESPTDGGIDISPSAAVRKPQMRPGGGKSPSGKPGTDAAGGGATGPLMTVLVRNEFYRDGFRNMMFIAVVQTAIIIALLIAFVSYMNATKSQDHYFAT